MKIQRNTAFEIMRRNIEKLIAFFFFLSFFNSILKTRERDISVILGRSTKFSDLLEILARVLRFNGSRTRVSRVNDKGSSFSWPMGRWASSSGVRRRVRCR